jgi:bidirectional [NiFe] hydrogenase diaphorase subunit
LISLSIDGNSIEVEEGTTILQAAGELGIKIPTLCYHPGLETIGACRLCVVEISKLEWNGHKKLEPSCLYVVEDGLIVNTQTSMVRESRKMLLNLLLARSPDSEVIRKLADEYGIHETSFPKRKDADNCILCMTCVQICEAIGVNAIAPLYRGPNRVVDVPRPDDCIGCLACALSCPTNAIPFEETDDKRRIWGKEFDLVRCWASGEPIGTLEQIWHFAKRSDIPIDSFLKSDKVREREDAAESVGVKI